MEWENNQSPETGAHLVSVQWQRSHGIMAFTYVAYYDKEANTWYKYNPFEDNYKPTEEVEGEVTAWAKNTSVFLK